MPSIVALDIETTGLDPHSDVIIEIGAVRFSGSRVEGEWTTLVNPGRPIPSFISQLTGITNEMVRNAPPLKAVLQELVDFVGNAPVLGHNVRFDLSFLQKQKILLENDVLDTYELASVLMPTASRYNLGALGRQMGVIESATHRALDDARVTHADLCSSVRKGRETTHWVSCRIRPPERNFPMGRSFCLQSNPASPQSPTYRYPPGGTAKCTPPGSTIRCISSPARPDRAAAADECR